MNKKIALKCVLDCSTLYHNNLENRNIIFILQDKSKKFSSIEITFLPDNFLHLTGLKLVNNKIKTASNFYTICLRKQLSISDFEFNSNGTTPKKLKILPLIMQIHKNAKIAGDYNDSKKDLKTKKLIGNINFCLGCVKNNYYMPNTALNEDIRNITYNQERIVMILRKNIKDKEYNEITYINKKILNEDREALIKYCSSNNIIYTM